MIATLLYVILQVQIPLAFRVLMSQREVSGWQRHRQNFQNFLLLLRSREVSISTEDRKS